MMFTRFRIKEFVFIALLCSILSVSCTEQDTHDTLSDSPKSGIVFKLYEEGYQKQESRTAESTVSAYDYVSHYIVDEDGNKVQNLKSYYDYTTSEIRTEGLHAGNYRLLILGIKGNPDKDNATIYEPATINDAWLVFPSDLGKPLEAEYFYSQTPFTVADTETADGTETSATVVEKIVQKRIIGKTDFSFVYNNPYVNTAVTSKRMQLDNGVCFFTTLNGSGSYSGKSSGQTAEISLDEKSDYLFMPLTTDSELSGSIIVTTQDYRQETASQEYRFNQNEIQANHEHVIETRVNHPDDMSAVMFVNRKAYDAGNHAVILADDEKKEVYTNASLRKFNTANPLQLSVTENGEFHARFYSPRKLTNVLIKAHIPAISDEYIDFAYFDSIPAFCDFYESIPLTQRTTMCRTESGKIIQVAAKNVADLAGAKFKLESDDPYLERLKGIKHGWNIYWGLFGGNPDLEDGGPAGNWMGIRPVHCREAVAFFLNFTYMIDMQEHEDILHKNAHQLYDDSGQLVKVENVLKQMRQERTIQVGLVYSGNNVLGLGSPWVFGAYQPGWLEHYTNRYACNVMFHELGHVMGYGHSSSFTYGPWAEKLMNNFYVDNIHKMPIDSPKYLNSSQNPNRYK